MTIYYYQHFTREFEDITLAEAYHSADSLEQYPELGLEIMNAKAYALLQRVAQIKSKITDHHGESLAPKDWTLPVFVRKIAGMDFEKLPHVQVILENPVSTLMAFTYREVNGGSEVFGFQAGENFFTIEQVKDMFPSPALTLS